MSTFIKSELGTLLDTIIDYRGKTPKKLKGDWALFGIPALSAKNIKQGKIVNYESIRYVDNDLYSRWMKEKVRRGDILMTSEAPLGETYYVKNDEKLLLSQRLFAIRPKRDKLDSRFLFYYFNSLLGKHELLSRATGTTVGGIRQTALIKTIVRYPENIVEQKNISSVLGTYDDLIENNEKRIKLLEEMVARLYHEWFVKFKFPGHEKSKMIDGGTGYGKIPQGWEIKRLGEIADLIMGQSPTSDHYNTENKGLPFHQGVADFGSKYPLDRVYSTAGNKTAEQGDLLFSVRAPVGRMNIANKKIILGRGLSAIRHKELFQSFLFLAFANRFTEKDMIGNGAIYKSVNKAELEKLQFIAPEKNILERFERIVSTYFQLMENLTNSNERLSKTRDLLIPQLVTGKRELK